MTTRWVWLVMMIGIGIEFALGVACLVLVPVGRPDQWLPPQSRGVYVAHAVLGGLLAIAALTILITVLDGSRFRASARRSASSGSPSPPGAGCCPCRTLGGSREWD